MDSVEQRIGARTNRPPVSVDRQQADGPFARPTFQTGQSDSAPFPKLAPTQRFFDISTLPKFSGDATELIAWVLKIPDVYAELGFTSVDEMVCSSNNCLHLMVKGSAGEWLRATSPFTSFHRFLSQLCHFYLGPSWQMAFRTTWDARRQQPGERVSRYFHVKYTLGNLCLIGRPFEENEQIISSSVIRGLGDSLYRIFASQLAITGDRFLVPINAPKNALINAESSISDRAGHRPLVLPEEFARCTPVNRRSATIGPSCPTSTENTATSEKSEANVLGDNPFCRICKKAGQPASRMPSAPLQTV